MARKNLADDLVVLPWWVLLILAAIVYVVLKYWIPTIDVQNMFLKPLVPAASQFAGPLSLLIVLIAFVSALRSWRKRVVLEKQTGVSSIQDLSWQQFEYLVGEAYKRKGYSVTENVGVGADEGIDLVLNKDGAKTLVQCKNWKSGKVGVGVVREMLGSMTSKGAAHGVVVCSGDFTQPAQTFAKENHIELVTGKALTRLIGDVQQSKNMAVEKVTEEVLCPTCNSSMVRRTSKRGARAGTQFWGCSRYPKCKGTIN